MRRLKPFLPSFNIHLEDGISLDTIRTFYVILIMSGSPPVVIALMVDHALNISSTPHSEIDFSYGRGFVFVYTDMESFFLLTPISFHFK